MSIGCKLWGWDVGIADFMSEMIVYRIMVYDNVANFSIQFMERVLDTASAHYFSLPPHSHHSPSYLSPSHLSPFSFS